MSAITATTVQDTRRVHEVFPLPPDHVARQIDAAVRDPGVDSAKTGMIPSPETVEAVCRTGSDSIAWSGSWWTPSSGADTAMR